MKLACHYFLVLKDTTSIIPVMLRKIEFYLTPSKLDHVRDLLLKRGIEGMSVTQIEGFGIHSPRDRTGRPVIEKRIKLEIVMDELIVDDVITDIKKLVLSEKLGYGRIFVIPVEDAIKVSTGEFGITATK